MENTFCQICSHENNQLSQVLQDYEKKAKKGQTATKESSKLKKILRERDKEVKKI